MFNTGVKFSLPFISLHNRRVWRAPIGRDPRADSRRIGGFRNQQLEHVAPRVPIRKERRRPEVIYATVHGIMWFTEVQSEDQ